MKGYTYNWISNPGRLLPAEVIARSSDAPRSLLACLTKYSELRQTVSAKLGASPLLRTALLVWNFDAVSLNHARPSGSGQKVVVLSIRSILGDLCWLCSFGLSDACLLSWRPMLSSASCIVDS